MMRRLILGTAGHIDHGKTELVRALTGVDTDRLKEEKERGITIDLGFAEFAAAEDLQLGVVDVPGHEGFIRNMLAGATGMDVVLLVVAADEGVMPQTREHLSIVTLLGVDQLVVALTKSDLVDQEWLELVTEEVRELLADGPYRDAPLIPTSARTGQGLPELIEALRSVTLQVEADDATDVVRLPIDRVFTVRGTGTVVTGTLWSGTLKVGARAHLLPGGLSARIRGLQVHGRDVEEARAGERTAVALTGQEVERHALSRGQVLVSDGSWGESTMLTVHVRVLADSTWAIEQGQRLRVHLGTAERMARVVLLDREVLMPGEEGWAQLRLEAPAVARARERIVLRSYSPVTTIGGGVVAEPFPPKRKWLEEEETACLDAVLAGEELPAIAARAHLAGWAGDPRARLPVATGIAMQRIEAACSDLPSVVLGIPTDDDRRPRLLGDSVMAASHVKEGARHICESVQAFHAAQPLRPGQDVETLRQSLPRGTHPALADALLQALVSRGLLLIQDAAVSHPEFRVTPSPAQKAMIEALAAIFGGAVLAPPAIGDLPQTLRDSADLWPLLRMMEAEGLLTRIEGELFIWSEALRSAGEDVTRLLGGREDLGPADFKEALPVTRKHLLPILAHFDQVGVTQRRGTGRAVPLGPDSV